jgi:uncharacterized LabA/DUF88 family protein
MTQARLNIAVFIDFDNIEIGVKSTLGERFDVGAVLEAIKERGEVVTKIAYGDWTRAGDYSRMLTNHAIRMVQRNLTPGGDKNGADINLALDALEMAFAHDHINAFVIVGGDSDFITLVEKLKQYDKTVFVVGGRAFTSQVLQKNCHEFMAYENIMKTQSAARRPVDRTRPAAPIGDASLTQALPLIRRALKVLADREVSAQLGLLKSTLLQLDSTFSERNYGSSSFRDFMQKLANAGFVVLKGQDRSLHVELRETDGGAGAASPPDAAAPVVETPPVPVAVASIEPDGASDPALWAEGVKAMHAVFLRAPTPPRWPMYVRNVRQFLRIVDETFDERRYGFRGIVDAVRMAQREGLFRVERDRRGILRVFPGPLLQRPAGEVPAIPGIADEAAEWPADAENPADAAAETSLGGDGLEPMAAVGAAADEPIELADEASPSATIEVVADVVDEPAVDVEAEPVDAPRARTGRRRSAPKTASRRPARRKKSPSSAV